MNKNTSINLLILFLIIPAIGLADCPREDNSRCVNTILGPLIRIPRSHSGDGYSHLTINNQDIYKAKTSYFVMAEYDIIQKDKKYFVNKGVISYTSDDPCFPEKPASRCGINVVLDLTSGKPVISNTFFSENGESQITWVSWGKANSIIVIDDELRFKYANGHVERITKDKNSSTGSDGGK